MEELQSVIAMIGDVGIWAVFAYFFMDERKRHDETRKAHNEDLRDVAGLRTQLRHPAAQQDTQPAQDIS